MAQALTPGFEASGELLDLLAARRAAETSASAADSAQRLLVRALREAGVDEATVALVEGAPRPSLVPASLSLGAVATSGDEVVRAAQHRLVDAITAGLVAGDELAVAEERLDAVLPVGLRAASVSLRGLAARDHPVHDLVVVEGAGGVLEAATFVCGRPRAATHQPVTAPSRRTPCADCRAIRRSDGPFEPEVVSIGHIERSRDAQAPEREARSWPVRSPSLAARHPLAWQALTVLRLAVVIALVVAAFAIAVAGITGNLDLVSLLPH